MDPSLDPRLQPQSSSHQPNPNVHPRDEGPSQSYPGATVRDSPLASKQTSLPGSANPPPTPTQQQQQHQYYGVATPTSYTSDGAVGHQQTYPYDNGISPYGASPPVNYGASLPTVAEVAADLKRPRACEACRQLKVKCEPDDVVAGTCRRCFRSNRQCVVTMPTRKRQKKTDSRVAELEKKIDALTASLHSQGDSGPGLAAVASDTQTQLQLQALEETRAALQRENGVGQWMSEKAPTDNNTEPEFRLPSPSRMRMQGTTEYGSRRVAEDVEAPAAKGVMGRMPNLVSVYDQQYGPGFAPQQEYVDIIDRKVMDAKSAYQCFDRYVEEMAPALPFVVFPPGTRAEEIRKSKPVLFLAIVSVSCGTVRMDLYPSLIAETMRMYADRVVCRGEKSMEIVQALLVSTTWYAPPERYEELNFNQLIHMAAVMAIDIGMGKRVKPGYMGVYKEYVDKKAFSRIPEPEAPETRRTWLGCYYMCANAAMSLRRPLLIRWTGYMDDCLDLLENSKEAIASDKWLVCITRGQHIAEDVGFQFSMDDPTSEISISEPKTQYHLKAFDRQLNEWKSRTPKDIQPTSLFAHFCNITTLYTHEIAMHQDHNIDDFKPPYTAQPDAQTNEPDVLTPAHIDSLTVCIQSIHAAFDAMLSMETSLMRSLPTLSYVRTSYAAVALIKLCSAISGPKPRFGSVFKPEDLKADFYLDALTRHIRPVGENGSKVAAKFCIIFGMLHTWLQKRSEPESKSNPPRSEVKTGFAPVKSVLGEATIQQDPSSSQWSNSMPTPPEGGPRQSGLHMLSELASSSNNAATDMSLAELNPMVAASASWPQQYAGLPAYGPSDGPVFGTMGGVDLDMMGFEEQDLDYIYGVLSGPPNVLNDSPWVGGPTPNNGWNPNLQS